MAQGTKPAAAAAAPAGPTNGAHAASPAATTPVNRKKQKRREKEAAKKAAGQQRQPQQTSTSAPAGNPPVAHHHTSPGPQAPHYADPDYDDDDDDDDPPYEDDQDYFSDDDADQYARPYASNGHYYAPTPDAAGAGKKAKKGPPAPPQQPAHSFHHMPPRPTPMPLISAHVARAAGPKKDRIWNTTTQEERERIREFWLSLSEDERKSLVKIEKEAVLRKMKEQQKHSCSCTVCGRKRTAIEEELEVLYDAYYEELEHAPRRPPLTMAHPPPGPHYDDTDELSGEEDEDEDFSNSEISSDEEYSEEERLPPPDTDFLQFGSSLQVKGGILTVADDLLKNDGKKFIEMMEQLAERRMQREEEAQYHGQGMAYRNHTAHNHAPPPEEDEFDDDDDEDDGYEDGSYEEEDEDEDEAMTEEQRMEEGRRMFQIFAARMFEQRVLQAYKEKVAAERQQRLLEELAEEDDKKEQKEAKKAKEAQKRKEKKEKVRLAKQAEKEKKDAEAAAREEEARVAEAARQEEQKRRKEEQRKKKEASRKVQEEEKQRKEAERLRRQQEERDRQQEAERKAREQKAQEKKARDDAKRKEREEREAKDKEAREKKAHDDKARKEKEAARAKADKDRSQKELQAAAAAQNASTPTKRLQQPVAPALPPQLLKQNSSTGYPSPHVTPAIPKAPTPNRPRQSSQQGSHGDSPKNFHIAPGTSSKSMSPSPQAQIPVVPKSILTKPPSQHPTPAPHTQPSSPMLPLGPPPGMPIPPGMGLGMNVPPGLNGFPGQGMIPGMMGPGGRMPIFPQQQAAQNFRPFPPPGMHAPNMMQMGRGYPGMDAPPPGFGPMPGFPGPNNLPQFGMGVPGHSRQPSYDKPATDSPIAAPQAQPIQRPTPIQRPSSVKPHDEKEGQGGDVDELANHLGSKALLDDEEDIAELPEAGRRTSLQQHGSIRAAPLGFGFADPPNQARPDLHAPFAGSTGGSVWGTPPMPFPMPNNAAGWGNSPTSSMFNSPFSMMGAPRNNEQRGPNEQRLVWLRRVVCTTCKMLALRQPGTDGYVDAGDVHSHIDSCRAPAEPRVSVEEIKEACDIIGDSSNGGGNLDYKELRPGPLSHIKFVEAGGPPPTLGEIGSPIPSHSVPVGGFGAGRPFPGLGPQGF
ncbi:hypothetical protein P280DRAFT_465889 [Massarina eburnea CBS 473.64]|uniref:Stress response protein NST1 n=1 Tax=Massarina eburnea CBS 473.64 TaxID=1395130 RepID=A0A6A6SBL2_9PLEO|nr:hypothetical protein P280DRAFT_465889 [Massarina eburnea CBS 473.64]